MQRTFEMIHDAGHGWAKVPLSLLPKLGLTRESFTSYSYLRFDPKRGKFADVIYLEEDCDLSLFCKVYRERTGNDPKFRDRHCDQARLRTGRWYYNNSTDPRFERFF